MIYIRISLNKSPATSYVIQLSWGCYQDLSQKRKKSPLGIFNGRWEDNLEISRKGILCESMEVTKLAQ